MVVPTNKKLSNEKDKIKKKNEGELFFLKSNGVGNYIFLFFKKKKVASPWIGEPMDGCSMVASDGGHRTSLLFLFCSESLVGLHFSN